MSGLACILLGYLCMERTAVVKIGTVFGDGSGVDAIVTVDGRVYAANFCGEIVLHLLKGPSSRRARDAAKKAFRTALANRVDHEWFALNFAMYSKCPQGAFPGGVR